MLTQPGTNIAFDWPSPAVTSIEEDEDASKQATTYLVTAQGSTDDAGSQTPLIARSDNDDLLNAGIPALWRVDSSNHSSVSIQATLDGYAQSSAKAYHDPVMLRPIKVRADDPVHPYGSYRVGDTIQITVTGDPWIPDGSYTQRIIDMAVSGLEVTLTVSEVPA